MQHVCQREDRQVTHHHGRPKSIARSYGDVNTFFSLSYLLIVKWVQLQARWVRMAPLFRAIIAGAYMGDLCPRFTLLCKNERYSVGGAGLRLPLSVAFKGVNGEGISRKVPLITSTQPHQVAKLVRSSRRLSSVSTGQTPPATSGGRMRVWWLKKSQTVTAARPPRLVNLCGYAAIMGQ